MPSEKKNGLQIFVSISDLLFMAKSNIPPPLSPLKRNLELPFFKYRASGYNDLAISEFISIN